MANKYLDLVGAQELVNKIKSLIPKYGTCPTEAATAAKVITLTDTNFALVAGAVITVKFTYTNTASNPTFNVNNTGAKRVWYNTALITTGSKGYAGTANRPMMYVYDGTQWVFVGWAYDANTTYTNMTQTEATTGTATTARSISAKVLNDTIDDKISGLSTPSFELEALTDTYSVAANGNTSGSIDLTKTGYTPIAIAGFAAGNVGISVIRCDIWTSDNAVHYHVKNTTSSALNNITFTAKITYVKN